MKNILIILAFLLPVSLSAQLLRSYGVVEIGSTFPTSSATGAKFAYRTVDSSYYRWVSGNTWVKIIEPSIIPDTLYLTEEIGTSYKVSGDTINLTPYLLKSDTSAMLVRYIERGDTASMLTNYPSTAGYGILKSSKTIRADTTSPNGLATRLFTKTLPTSIIADRSIRSNGSNLVVGNFTDNGTKVQALLPFQLQQWTTAGRPSGVTGYEGYNITDNGLEWYQGSRWAKVLESTFNRGTSGSIFFADANGQAAQDNANFFYNSSLYTLRLGSSGTADKAEIGSTDGSGNPYVRLFNAGIGDGYMKLISAVPAAVFSLNFGLSVSGAITTTSNFRAVGLASNGTDRTSNGAIGGELILRPNVANPAFINFTENGAAYWGNLGVDNGNGDLKYETSPSNEANWETGTTRLVIKQTGRVGIGSSTTVNYSLEQTGQTDGFGVARGTVAQRPTIVSSTTPFRFNTDSTALEYGESVGTWRLLATRAYARSLVSALPTTNIYTANGTLTSNRTITSGGFDLTLDTDVTVGDSLKVTTTPAHSAITGLLTRNTDGWVGLASIAGGLSYSGGVLTGANIYTADGNLGDNVTRTFSQGSNGDFIQYRTTTTDKRHKTYLSIPTGNADYDDEARVLYQSGGTKNRKISHYKAGGIYDGLGNYVARYQTSERNSLDNYVIDEIYASIGSGSTANFAGVLVGADSTNLNTISALKMITENAASQRTHWAGLVDNSFGNGGWGGLPSRMISYSPSFKVQTNFFNSNTYYDWLRIDNLNTDTTSNRISFYNNKYTFPNSKPSPTVKSRQVWTAGVPSWELDRKSLIDSLPLASVTIDANNNNFTIDNLGNLDFITIGGTGTVHLDDDNFNVEAVTEITLANHDDASLTLNTTANIQSANTEGVIGFKVGGEQWLWHYVNDDADADTAMTMNTVGNEAYLRLHDYGNGNINATMIGEYPGKYIPSFTTTGKVLDYQLARDTFIEDVTLFAVGTIMYSCQELTVISSMTGTAPTHQEIRFPDAAEEYRGKKIIVFSRRKDASIYVPQIKVVGGASRLYFTTTPGIGGADPSDQSILSLDDVTWPEIGTYEFTCLKINSTDYRWVLKQR